MSSKHGSFKIRKESLWRRLRAIIWLQWKGISLDTLLKDIDSAKEERARVNLLAELTDIRAFSSRLGLHVAYLTQRVEKLDPEAFDPIYGSKEWTTRLDKYLDKTSGMLDEINVLSDRIESKLRFLDKTLQNAYGRD